MATPMGPQSPAYPGSDATLATGDARDFSTIASCSATGFPCLLSRIPRLRLPLRLRLGRDAFFVVDPIWRFITFHPPASPGKQQRTVNDSKREGVANGIQAHGGIFLRHRGEECFQMVPLPFGRFQGPGPPSL